MSRDVHALTVPDISALARSLRRALEARDARPSHLELLNLLARGAGFRNFQHLKASDNAAARLQALEAAARPEPVDHRRIEQVLRCFDAQAVMARWPKKTSQQKLALWWCWAQIPARQDLPETRVNEILKSLNGFGDHVLIRRELIDWGMMSRSQDCRIYRRIEQQPPADAGELIRHLQARLRAAVPPPVSARPSNRPKPSNGPPVGRPVDEARA
ncbi:DUF2087 domain-containing protein [Rhizobium sp. SSA_523]|uniref:DUF2087 domain-containing protein n=1 Tax=Rhizobium sp. SSA_523 TaxID=2952477 RepID=UPI002091B8BD|nr:DUF2087 domain-containing protein [Rhizobium sp. SSA_523]MCO5730975.1 DUF2087 domain-containing protein [Rhizobium sp. SSA_523]WKC24217.1 DUF2087 domain-containing protein [Rhizobium sp. SSA_523]